MAHCLYPISSNSWKLGTFGENDGVVMSFGDAIEKAIALTSQVLNADNPKLAKLILPMASFAVTK